MRRVLIIIIAIPIFLLHIVFTFLDKVFYDATKLMYRWWYKWKGNRTLISFVVSLLERPKQTMLISIKHIKNKLAVK